MLELRAVDLSRALLFPSPIITKVRILTRVTTERAILVGVALPPRAAAARGVGEPEESLDELAQLAESAGAEVVSRILQYRQTFNAATLLGSGKIEEIKGMAASTEADVVLFDLELGGAQQRNLEKALEIKVVDRTQLILDIFARRARTREGQLQVELAQLNYMLPRLVGSSGALSRLGGGIGTRGPGETKLETDRRRIKGRIRKIGEDLESVRGTRGTQRQQRQSVPLQTVALVGYTNAGKSTLFNRLTGAGVVADARMFATLDPTVRKMVLPSNRKVLLSDTVGFIRNLPTTLVQAFRATLEETREAALLLHVVDASSEAAGEHISHVRQVLEEIGAADTRQILLLNKIDSLHLNQDETAALVRRFHQDLSGPMPIPISAQTGDGIPELLQKVDDGLVLDPLHQVSLRLPHAAMGVLSLVHRQGRVLQQEYDQYGCNLQAMVPESLLARLVPYISTPVHA